MQEVSPEVPASIYKALGNTDDDALMTVAAFMLAAGARSTAKFFIEDELIGEEELEQLGLHDWWRSAEPFGKPPPIDEFREFFYAEDWLAPADARGYYSQLAELIDAAIGRGTAEATQRAVAKATTSPDDLVRICALTSAVELFQLDLGDMHARLGWFVGRELNPTARVLLNMLTARVARAGGSARDAAGPAPSGQGSGGAPPGAPPGTVPGAPSTLAPTALMLIHGTNFPPGRPEWSVPGSGQLFNYLQPKRPDLYGQPDYFRWEGGYSDYAREVAAYNLNEWLKPRAFSSVDAITHSHGGNVLMAATRLGAIFDNAIFLSCPVHWPKYRIKTGSVLRPQSIRVKLDFVILGDRGGQRFPKAAKVPEHVLPFWFVKHDATYQPANWQSQNLDQYL